MKNCDFKIQPIKGMVGVLKADGGKKWRNDSRGNPHCWQLKWGSCHLPSLCLIPVPKHITGRTCLGLEMKLNTFVSSVLGGGE
jgi:hypothetical protein